MCTIRIVELVRISTAGRLESRTLFISTRTRLSLGVDIRTGDIAGRAELALVAVCRPSRKLSITPFIFLPSSLQVLYVPRYILTVAVMQMLGKSHYVRQVRTPSLNDLALSCPHTNIVRYTTIHMSILSVRLLPNAPVWLVRLITMAMTTIMVLIYRYIHSSWLEWRSQATCLRNHQKL